MTTSPDRQAFMKAFEEATTPGPEQGERLLDNKVVLHLEEQPDMAMKIGANEVYLTNINALEPEKGHGTRAMAFLGDLASKYGIDIVLHAMGNKENSPSDWELVQFYKKHGFMKCGSNNAMFRPANGPA